MLCATKAAGVRLLMLAAIIVPPVAAGEEPRLPERPTHNLYGLTGLIDLPSAEMQPDGQISISTSYFGEYWRTTASAQIFPGVEGAFRYTVLDEFLADGETLYDRSFDVKIRVITESDLRPNVVVGLQDFLGTGVYSGEYVASTKRFFEGDLAVTGGIGWGRLSGVNGFDNVFCNAFDSFCDRGSRVEQGGKVRVGDFFQGEEMALFGGVEWRTPVDGLTLKAEYSSDDYAREEASGEFDRDIPFNFGVEYRPTPGLEVGAYYLYGSEFGVRLTVSGNPFAPGALFGDAPPPLPVNPRPLPPTDAPAVGLGSYSEITTGTAPITDYRAAGITGFAVEERDGIRWATASLPPSAGDRCPAETATGIDAEAGMLDVVTYAHADGRAVCTVALRPEGTTAVRVAQRAATAYPTGWYDDAAVRKAVVRDFGNELEAEGIDLFGIEIRPERVTVYIENRRFFAMPRAVGRTARSLARTMPASVELFEIVPVEKSLPVAAISLRRSDVEDFVDRPDGARNIWAAARLEGAPKPNWSEVDETDEIFPRTSWGIIPYVPVSLFDPDEPLRADLQILLDGSVEVLPGLSASAQVSQRVVGNLDDITRESDSVLPRVRSDIAEYQRTETPVINRMTGDYVTKLDEDLYGRVSGGLLERMFGGISGEILWKPEDQSWGVGGELNWVQQRDFEGYFGFQDYDVVTGHGSLYWDTGFYGLAAQVDAGRYLAGDWGGTFTLKRRFANGWEVGAFFTLTDVPFDDFGEGSFDRGITLTIPFNWMLPLEGRGAYSTVIRPLTRDGGQRLDISNRLYPIVQDMDRGGFGTRSGGFWE